jgi:hypothetical protein
LCVADLFAANRPPASTSTPAERQLVAEQNYNVTRVIDGTRGGLGPHLQYFDKKACKAIQWSICTTTCPNSLTHSTT